MGEMEEEKGDMLYDEDGALKNEDSIRDLDKMRQYEEMEAEIIRFCKENNCLWEDKEFLPGSSCLYKVLTLIMEDFTYH